MAKTTAGSWPLFGQRRSLEIVCTFESEGASLIEFAKGADGCHCTCFTSLRRTSFTDLKSTKQLPDKRRQQVSPPLLRA